MSFVRHIVSSLVSHESAAVDAPNDIFSVGEQVLWLRADNVTLNGPDRVSAWPDKFGGSPDFAQATTDRQPLHKPTGGPNSQASVENDGTDRYLFDNNASWLPTGDIWIFAVLKFDPFITADEAFRLDPTRLISNTAGDDHWEFDNLIAGNPADTAAIGTGYEFLMCRNEDDVEVAVTLNNDSEVVETHNTESSRTNDNAIVFARAGGGGDCECEYAELLMVNALSAGQFTDMGAYYNDRYGASLTW